MRFLQSALTAFGFSPAIDCKRRPCENFQSTLFIEPRLMPISLMSGGEVTQVAATLYVDFVRKVLKTEVKQMIRQRECSEQRRLDLHG